MFILESTGSPTSLQVPKSNYQLKMVFSIVKALCTAALIACASSAIPQVQAVGSPDPLCSLPPGTIIQAAQKYPTLAPAVKELSKHSSAIWYTDNEVAATMQSRINQMLSHCPDNSRLMLVVYGLPNKDCEAGFSNVGSNKNATDYKNFIQTLANLVGNRKVLYVVEPDAVGLVANGGCAVKEGYTDNIHTALQILSQNENADIYLDVGYWTLLGEASAIRIANAVKTLSTAGKLKGIALNSGHFRPTADMARLCTTFQNAYNSTSLNCVIDTSRNNNNNPTSTEWCNARFGGIGRPPTSNTDISNVDYLIWIKPVGESDGTCDSADLTPDAMKGPPAGQFFLEGFISLWNNGYYVQEKGFPALSLNSTYVQVKDIPALALNSTGRQDDPRRVDVELVHEDHASAGRASGTLRRMPCGGTLCALQFSLLFLSVIL
jgi:hypothetical protein